MTALTDEVPPMCQDRHRWSELVSSFHVLNLRLRVLINTHPKVCFSVSQTHQSSAICHFTFSVGSGLPILLTSSFPSFSLVHGSLVLQNVPLPLAVTPGWVIPLLFICMTPYEQLSPQGHTPLQNQSRGTLQMNSSSSPGTVLLLSI